MQLLFEDCTNLTKQEKIAKLILKILILIQFLYIFLYIEGDCCESISKCSAIEIAIEITRFNKPDAVAWVIGLIITDIERATIIVVQPIGICVGAFDGVFAILIGCNNRQGQWACCKAVVASKKFFGGNVVKIVVGANVSNYPFVSAVNCAFAIVS
mgnify:CR=1 FL=1